MVLVGVWEDALRGASRVDCFLEARPAAHCCDSFDVGTYFSPWYIAWTPLRTIAEMENMEPRVTKRDRKLHLSYDLPHRIRCAQVYPIAAPNGSTLILYGHDRGLGILWRGGRRVKQQPPPAPAPKPAKSQDVIVIDDSDDEPPPPPTEKPVEYEDEEDEMDPDAPYAPIIQDVDVELGSAVLHIAVPSVPQQPAQRPGVVRDKALVAVYTTDGHVSTLRIPLAPPAPNKARDWVNKILKERTQLSAGKALLRGLAIKVHTRFPDEEFPIRTGGPEHTVLVAGVSDALRLWQLPLRRDAIHGEPSLQQRLPLSTPAVSVTFHPAQNSTQVLLADTQGTARLYDLTAPKDSSLRPGSSDSSALQPNELGCWIMTFSTPYTQSQPASMPARKKILDARYLLQGRAILVLLEDGEWGIWDLQPQGNNKSPEAFVLSGFLSNSSAPMSSGPSNSRKTNSKLAPMTPNTRKSKSETFFAGSAKPAGAVSHGGISVLSMENSNGSLDESAYIHFNSAIYAIPNTHTFFQRAASSSGSFLQTSSPSLTRIPDLNLFTESITSLCPLPSRHQAHQPSFNLGLGQMNTNAPADFLLAAEHRFIISQSTRPPVPARGLFQSTGAEKERDQRMLDVGALDLGGMDRMLDSMAAGGGRRKVGFAA